VAPPRRAEFLRQTGGAAGAAREHAVEWRHRGDREGLTHKPTLCNLLTSASYDVMPLKVHNTHSLTYSHIQKLPEKEEARAGEEEEGGGGGHHRGSGERGRDGEVLAAEDGASLA